MYVPAPHRPRIYRVARWIAWRTGDLLAAVLSKVTGFRVHDEPLQPFAIKIPMLLGIYERESVRLVRRIVRPGSIVVDGGAHGGYFTRLFSKLVGPTGRVLAFEIHPTTLELLRLNTRSLTNVEIIPAALGPIDGEATLFESSGLSSSHSATATKPGLTASTSIPMRSVDSALNERALDHVDFIKLDIEGGEPGVLRALAAGPVTVMFEVKRYILEGAGETPEKLMLELMDRGFDLSREDRTKIHRIDLARKNSDWDKANVVAVRNRQPTSCP